MNKPSPKKSLVANFPNLVKEWHPTKNGKLTPYGITCGSSKKAWWICSKGHEWEAKVYSRKVSGCPYCSNHKACKDNCLETLFPELAKDWHPFKNFNLTAKDVTYASGKKVWWVCSRNKNHEWMASVYNRTLHGNGCSCCSGKTVCSDNSLSNCSPQLLKEWDYTKNKGLTPSDFTIRSRKKAWWICQNKHSHLSPINSRVECYLNGNNGCLYCCNQIMDKENIKNSFGCTYEEMLSEWDFKKNNISPYEIAPFTLKKVWWKCRKGHSYLASVMNRTKNNSGCPHCCKIELRDGAICNSVIEAIMYMHYKRTGLAFTHNKRYPIGIGRRRYDFYLVAENKYVETTSYKQSSSRWIRAGYYFRYLRNIVKKRRFVEDVLKARFEFIQFTPTRDQIHMVRNNIK